MPASPTGITSVSSGQILSAHDFVVTDSSFGGYNQNLFLPNTPNKIRSKTLVAIQNLRSIMFYVMHFATYQEGTPAAPGALWPARLDCSWRPVFQSSPSVIQSTATSPADWTDPAVDAANPWVPLVPPQLCAPGIPSFIKLDCGGASFVAVEINISAQVGGQLDRFRIFIHAAA